jgi:hypothetical protein
MTIEVGQIEIQGSNRLVLPDLRDSEVVDRLRENAERDAVVSQQQRVFWWKSRED